MIVDDLYIECVCTLPAKTDAPLIIDANTELPLAIAAQFLKSIVRWNSQFWKLGCIVEHSQLSTCEVLDFDRQVADWFAIPDAFGVARRKGFDHNL